MYLTAVVSLALIAAATRAEITGNVAFTAVVKNDIRIEAGNPVVFTDVITNKGDSYDPATGEFTTHRHGLYAFHVHGMSTSDEAIQLDIYKNDVYVASAQGQLNSGSASGSNTVTLRLNNKDKVSVRTGRKSNSFGRPDQVYLTFTGYLIGELTSSK